MGVKSFVLIVSALLFFIFEHPTGAAEQGTPVPTLSPSESRAAADSALEGPTVNGLQIKLSADKADVTVGEEIHFEVTFINHSAQMFRIFTPSMFLGDEFAIQDAAGHEIPREGGFIFFSPKRGVFMGTTQIIRPAGSFERALEAWIDPRYRLVFGGRERTEPLNAEARTRLGVPDEYPDKYISTGRIFALPKPGRYRMTFHYEKTDDDRNWRIDSDPDKNRALLSDIWTGRVNSNTVTIHVR